MNLNKNRWLALDKVLLMQKRLGDALGKQMSVEFCIQALETYAAEFSKDMTLGQYIDIYCTLAKRLRHVPGIELRVSSLSRNVPTIHG